MLIVKALRNFLTQGFKLCVAYKISLGIMLLYFWHHYSIDAMNIAVANFFAAFFYVGTAA